MKVRTYEYQEKNRIRSFIFLVGHQFESFATVKGRKRVNPKKLLLKTKLRIRDLSANMKCQIKNMNLILMSIVKRKGSNKQKSKLYEAFEFTFGSSLSDLANFLGDLGEISRGQDSNFIDMYTWIDLEDGRRICPDQYLVKWRGKILSFDPTIFYDWFEGWNI